MRRKFLEDMGLTKEQVDSIMEENGKDITREQTVATGYKKQLDDVQEKMKAFDGVDVKELQGKITALTNDLSNTKASYETKIEDMKFNSFLEGKIASMKPKNSKAVMALLDLDSLKKSKNQDSDIDFALEKVKKENDFLFDAEQGQKPQGRVVTSTSTTQIDVNDKKQAANEAFRACFGR